MATKNTKTHKNRVQRLKEIRSFSWIFVLFVAIQTDPAPPPSPEQTAAPDLDGRIAPIPIIIGPVGDGAQYSRFPINPGIGMG
jgi:hypothetical protein